MDHRTFPPLYEGGQVTTYQQQPSSGVLSGAAVPIWTSLPMGVAVRGGPRFESWDRRQKPSTVRGHESATVRGHRSKTHRGFS